MKERFFGKMGRGCAERVDRIGRGFQRWCDVMNDGKDGQDGEEEYLEQLYGERLEKTGEDR